jgi:hypothetical protein
LRVWNDATFNGSTIFPANPFIRVRIKEQWINHKSPATNYGRTVLELDQVMESRGPQVFNGVNWLSATNRGIRIPYTALYSINLVVLKNNEYYDSSGLWDDHHVEAHIILFHVEPTSVNFN